MLPAASTWYVVTNRPHPAVAPAIASTLYRRTWRRLCASIVRLYGLRQWVEQGYRQAKGALGWADVQVRSDRAIRRHWQLVCCAFSFCWWAYLRRQATIMVDQALETAPALAARPMGGERKGRGGTPDAVVAGRVAAGTGLARPLDDALALGARVVERAPATRRAGAA